MYVAYVLFQAARPINKQAMLMSRKVSSDMVLVVL